ncbi:right-handed parallel beta-helix repeat-containing protein [Peribacillus frigoritolerans]|uniref:right-handed parallel beta-helix repeat-containing protein n=1 Tax=Peribacillus frigoritolerans TaxID=450367 RepID=UPI002E2102B6|nr:right-handed parallel beta-helix repeat-containing protein [Peribacillus frigoritolerans]MED3845531.1 right-handed parallel beta-helix repeat-containing protein [Peribacillus frigoritolerans]
MGGYKYGNMGTDFEARAQLADIAVSVKKFGAVGNGIKDDTEAIQKAIDSLGSKGGKVKFEYGKTYRTTYTLFYRSKITLSGYGATIDFQCLAGNASILLSDNMLTGAKISDITIEGLAFKQNAGALLHNAIGLSFAENVLIRDVQSTGLGYHLIDVAASKHVKIERALAKNHPSAAYQVDSTSEVAQSGVTSAGQAISNIITNESCEDITFEDCVSEGCDFFANLHRQGGKNITFKDCKGYDATFSFLWVDENTVWNDVLFENCRFYQSQGKDLYSMMRIRGIVNRFTLDNVTFVRDNAISQYGVWLNTDSTTAGDSYRFKAINCHFNGFRSAFNLTRVNRYQLINNEYERCADDGVGNAVDRTVDNHNATSVIQLQSASNGKIQGSGFNECKYVGISLRENVKKLLISENVFDNIGISVQGVGAATVTKEDITVRNNDIVAGSQTWYGIMLGKTLRPIVKNNEIQVVNRAGVSLVGCSDGLVEDNIIPALSTNDASPFGIRLYESTGIHLSSNQVTGFATQSYLFDGATASNGYTGDTNVIPNVGGATHTGILRTKASAIPAGNIATALQVGSVVENTNPTAGGYLGWTKTSTGWKGYALIES